MKIKMLKCQNCKEVQIFDSYEVIRHPDSSRIHWMPNENLSLAEGFELPYMVFVCPKCKHGNYTDNVAGHLKYSYVEVDNVKIAELIK